MCQKPAGPGSDVPIMLNLSGSISHSVQIRHSGPASRITPKTVSDTGTADELATKVERNQARG
jgi:hypothetical protein